MDIRPQDLPELRAELARHMASERAHVQLGRFDENRMTTGESIVGNISAADLQRDETARLEGAELFYVSAEMTELAKAAAESLPFFDLERADLPSEHGFMFFAEPFASYSNEGKPNAKVQACCWMVVGSNTLWLSFYTDWHSWLEECRGAGTFRSDAIEFCLKADHWLYLETFVFAPLAGRREVDGPWAEDAREIGVLENVVRAAWLLMQQPVTNEDAVEPDRAIRKRLRRAGYEPKPVRVIELRRPKGSTSAGGASRDYQHQWIVRGHWRQHWYPKRQVHRPVWIAPHIKGPEGAPLIGGEKVYAWKR